MSLLRKSEQLHSRRRPHLHPHVQKNEDGTAMNSTTGIYKHSQYEKHLFVHSMRITQ